MSDALLDRLVEDVTAKGYSIFGFHGTGEPLLRKDLEEIIVRFGSHWIGSLTTNGVLLTEKRLQHLLKVGLNHLYISLDTLNPDLYARTRGGKIDRVIGHIQQAGAAAPEVLIQVGLMNHKEQEINESVKQDFAAAFGESPNIQMHVYECGNMPSAAEDWTRFQGHRVPSCSAPAHFLTILCSGKVALCCADQDGKHILGDVATQSIEEIWYHRKNQETFRAIGLGVQGCPEVCMGCVLKRPTRSLKEVDEILYGPYEALVRKARSLAENQDIPEALKLYSQAYDRMPGNTELRQEMMALEKQSGEKVDNYMIQYTEGTSF